MASISIVLIHSDGTRDEYHCALGRCLVGSDPECEVVIEHSDIAPQHYELDLREDSFLLEDLESGRSSMDDGKTFMPAHEFTYPQKVSLGNITLIVGSEDATGSEGDAEDVDVTQAVVNFSLGAEIGAGGMGSVLNAEDTTLGRAVAMKVMRLEASDSEDARSTFLREAAILGRLEHPNIVPIHNLGQDADGRLFYTMKLVRGRTLQSILSNLKRRDEKTIAEWPLDKLLEVYRKVCDAMSYAHFRGVIHRDLKPENIMVGEFGEVLLMDWGLAKVIGDDEDFLSGTMPGFQELSDGQIADMSSALTLEGAVMGTPQYMAPEQAAGKTAELDERTDVFALGGILYSILTLRPPVTGKSLAEIVRKLDSGSIPSPSIFNPSSTLAGKEPLPDGDDGETVLVHCPDRFIPPALSAVAMHALARDVEDRYQSVGDLESEIAAYQGGYGTRAENLSSLGQLRLLIKRNKVVSALSAILVISTTVLLFWLSKSLVSATRNEKLAKQQSERAEIKAEEAAAAQAQAALALERGKVALADSAYLDADRNRMIDLLDSVHTNQLPPLEYSSWRYLNAKRDASGESANLSEDPFNAIVPVPGSGGVFVVIVGKPRASGEVQIVDVRTRQITSRSVDLPRLSRNNEPSVSADGRFTAVMLADGRVAVVDITLAKVSRIFPATKPPAFRIVMGPKGDRILVCAARRMARMYDIADNKLLWEKKLPVFRLAYSPKGDQIAVYQAGLTKILYLLDPDSGEETARTSDDVGYLVNLHYSPDGSMLAAGTIKGQIGIWRSGDASRIARLSVGSHAAHSVQFLRNNDLVVVGVDSELGGISAARARRTLRFINPEAGIIFATLFGVDADTGFLGVDPDSAIALSGGANPRRWQLPLQKESHVIRHREASSGIGFLANGQWVGSRIADMRQTVMHFVDGKAEIVPGSPVQNAEVAISGDRKTTYLGNKLYRIVDGKLDLNEAISGNGKVQAMNHDGSLAVTGEVGVGGARQKNQLFETANPRKPIATLTPGDGRAFTEFVILRDRRVVSLTTADDVDGRIKTTLEIWGGDYSKPDQVITNSSIISTIAVNASGTLLAVGTQGKTITIRDVTDLSIVNQFRAHDGTVRSIAFHPSKPIIASCSNDYSVKIWNYQTGENLRTFLGPSRYPSQVDFSADGHMIGVSSNDKTTRFWDTSDL